MVSLRCIGRCKIFQLGQEKKTKVRFCIPHFPVHAMFCAPCCPAAPCPTCRRAERFSSLLSSRYTVTNRLLRVSPCSKSFGNEVLRHPLLSKYSWAFVFAIVVRAADRLSCLLFFFIAATVSRRNISDKWTTMQLHISIMTFEERTRLGIKARNREQPRRHTALSSSE
jgi:hypothetical protein